jgi:hypothetical protein
MSHSSYPSRGRRLDEIANGVTRTFHSFNSNIEIEASGLVIQLDASVVSPAHDEGLLQWCIIRVRSEQRYLIPPAVSTLELLDFGDAPLIRQYHSSALFCEGGPRACPPSLIPRPGV